MKNKIAQFGTVLLAGKGDLTRSIAVCLLKAGHVVNLWTSDVENSENAILAYYSDMKAEHEEGILEMDRLNVSGNLKGLENCGLAVIITTEELAVKQDKIRQLEDRLSPDVVIGINSEGIGLDALQHEARRPERIIGLNWVEPAHTTRFLEVIGNLTVKKEIVDQVCRQAKQAWKKDPYVVQNLGIRSRLLSAMVREAFYLVENDYASVEDIDRACRNDAGYYLPFAGNCRYMDLMGTYAYGMVMKDLNPYLSKEQRIPDFFIDILKEGGMGMQNGKGLYQYTDAEVKRWQHTFKKFSYQIEEIINKYPFIYKEKKSL